MIIDTHLHLIDRSALSYPWLADVPALDHDYLYETYRLQAQRAGIVATCTWKWMSRPAISSGKRTMSPGSPLRRAA